MADFSRKIANTATVLLRMPMSLIGKNTETIPIIKAPKRRIDMYAFEINIRSVVDNGGPISHPIAAILILRFATIRFSRLVFIVDLLYST